MTLNDSYPRFQDKRYFSKTNISKQCILYCPTIVNLRRNVPLTRGLSAKAGPLVNLSYWWLLT